MQVRCWNIPDQKVVDWADVHEMVTAAAFSSEGSRAVVGTMRGKCRFYQIDTSFRLDYQAQIGESHMQAQTSALGSVNLSVDQWSVARPGARFA